MIPPGVMIAVAVLGSLWTVALVFLWPLEEPPSLQDHDLHYVDPQPILRPYDWQRDGQ